jgi:hypothetical protein
MKIWGLCRCAHFFTRHAYKSFWLLAFSFSSLHAFEYQEGLGEVPRFCEHEWVMRYFNSLSDDTPIEEVIDFLLGLRAALQAKGYQVPPLSEMCLKMREYLIENGIELDDEVIEEIYNEILKREATLVSSAFFSHTVNSSSQCKVIEAKKEGKKKKDKNKKPELQISARTAKGFVKALGGGLLCIIPHPVAYGLGILLVNSGIKEMIEGAGDPPSGESGEDRMKKLPSPPEKSFG